MFFWTKKSIVKKDKLSKVDQNWRKYSFLSMHYKETPLHALLANPFLTQMTNEINNELE